MRESSPGVYGSPLVGLWLTLVPEWYALIIIAVTLAVLVSAKHTTIVEFLQPVTRTIRRWPGGWLIPIALLIVVSFPPLVGHESEFSGHPIADRSVIVSGTHADPPF